MGLGRLAGLVAAAMAATAAAAEDVLFHEALTYLEYDQATTMLAMTGMLDTGLLHCYCPLTPWAPTAHIATDEEWRSMTTADFAQYKAIVLADPNCGNLSMIDFLEDTKTVWSPAVTGNIILIGTDPGYHATVDPIAAGAMQLIDDGVNFATAGNGTGLYFAVSCYYETASEATIDALSEFGAITVHGVYGGVDNICYEDAHVVANSTALGLLNDTTLSNWQCSVHEVFTGYPTSGDYAFVPLAIADGATGPGQKDFSDGSSGIPYIIVKGATPSGCGNNIYEHDLEEQCDDGPLNGTPYSNCSSSCKCLYGSISPGVCAGNSTTTTSSSSLPTSSTSSIVSNSRYVLGMRSHI